MNDLKEESRITCLVPKQMLPNKKAFMDLGFTFQVIPNFELYLATLPKGWKPVANKGYNLLVDLFDEKGVKRGDYIYQPHTCSNHSISLNQRFYISLDFDPDDSTNSTLYIFVRDQTNGRVLFSAGSFTVKNCLEIIQLYHKAKKFLNDKYPDWEDPTKYWDLEEDTIAYWQREN